MKTQQQFRAGDYAKLFTPVASSAIQPTTGIVNSSHDRSHNPNKELYTTLAILFLVLIVLGGIAVYQNIQLMKSMEHTTEAIREFKNETVMAAIVQNQSKAKTTHNDNSQLHEGDSQKS